MYSLNYKVTTSTCDEQKRLKLYSALQMMQDCSELWIACEPGVEEFFRKEHRTQLLASRQVDIVRVPQYGEDLKVVSTVYGMKSMFGFRNTFIYDAEGKPCYKTWSMGAFVDRETGQLARVPQDVMDTMTLEKQLDMEYLDRRIHIPEGEFTAHEAYQVARNDIDYNHHVNNANYVRIVCEHIPADFQYTRMRIEFRLAVKFGETIRPESLMADGKLLFRLVTDAGVATLIEFS
jgi:medium-chain acyl-[acyl-carrier-protein] hydrolase